MMLSNLELYSMIGSEYGVVPQLQACTADEGLDQMQPMVLYFSLVIIIMKIHVHIEQ